MKEVKIPIIPKASEFVKVRGESHELNLKAITIFAATGFFLDKDTYWKDEMVLQPGTINTISDDGFLLKSINWFDWYHDPREIDFDQAVLEFQDIFENILAEQLNEESVILPLSGGLDSRTQALGISRLKKKVHSYSYSFKNGYPEHKIAKKVAEKCGFQFTEFQIKPHYLWDVIENLADLNGCYSEFTHARQMAVHSDLKRMKGVISLGHWGDVLFDKMVSGEEIKMNDTELIFKKIIKPGGLYLAKELWEYWGIEGSFEEYLRARVSKLLNEIKIDNKNARIRAFKSLYWAPRWTSTNLSVFRDLNRTELPYYSDAMCKFICELPEDYLANRKIQIAYLKQNNALAKITWEANKPLNLNNFEYDRMPYNLPYRIINRFSRDLMKLRGERFIQRNWEIQYMGEKNDQNLRTYLFDEQFYNLVPEQVISKVYENFKFKNAKKFSHPLSMLLTLSLWNKKFKDA